MPKSLHAFSAKRLAKTFLSSNRAYRERIATSPGEVSFQVVVEQTDLFVVAERDLSAEISLRVQELRGLIKSYMVLHPEFLKSLAPVEVPDYASMIVLDMARAARACGVGPMAAVAGAIADAVAGHFAAQSPNILVENGGDISMRSTRERIVALLATPESGARLGLRFPPGDFPVSVCASSGKVGHSLSFGQGDIVAVRAASGALADAAATSLANLLRRESDLNRVIARARELERVGVQGMFAQLDRKIAVWGRMELVGLE